MIKSRRAAPPPSRTRSIVGLRRFAHWYRLGALFVSGGRIVIINRRTYHNVPGKFLELLSLAKEFRELTRQEIQKDFRILTATYGPLATIVLEFEYRDEAEQQEVEP